MPAPDSTEPSEQRTDADLLADGRAVEERLRTARLKVLGRMPWSSNATLLCELIDGEDGDVDDDGAPVGDVVGRAIYKPHAGERPLWDFPDGLYRREIAAYDLATALGWPIVPPTIEADGPFGVGSLQWFVEADYDDHYFVQLEAAALHPQLRRLAAYDVVANSTDRKGGHVLRDVQDHLWAIDNGLCLHAEFKLRTVIWDFGGDPLDADLAEDLDRFVQRELPSPLAAVLDDEEREALVARVRSLLATGRLPTDPTGRRFPWPLV